MFRPSRLFLVNLTPHTRLNISESRRAMVIGFVALYELSRLGC